MTISDIAKMAGVSSAAVSRYFNHGYVSGEKKKAIQEAVERTGYRPSLQAQTLRTRKTRMIGVVLPRVNSSAVGGMVDGILPVLDEGGYQLLLADTRNNPEKELEYLSVFSEKQVDGMIFIGTIFSEAHRQVMRQMTLPLVVIGQYLAGCHCVYFNEYQSVYDMTKLVLDKGRTHLGFLGAPTEDEAAGAKRYRGFCNAVRDAGLGHLRDHCAVAGFTLADGYRKAGELWEASGGLDALVCGTDQIAAGAMQRLRLMGLRVPQDVMVTGHGDSGYSRVTTPSLTTVHYSYREAGALGARMVLDLLGAKQAQVSCMMMDYMLVERESTGGEAVDLSLDGCHGSLKKLAL